MNDAARVAFVARFVPAYRWPILEALNERLEGRLVVASGEPPGGSSLRSLSATSSSVPQLPLTNHWIHGDSLHWQSYSPLFRGDPSWRALLIEESPRTLSQRPLLRAARKRGVPTLLWGHFSSISRGFSVDSWRDQRRLSTARMADGVVTYTDALATHLRPHLGSMPIVAARNTLDTRKLFPLGETLMAEGRSAIRARLKLPDVPTLLFLGRLIAEIGPVRVVEIAEELARRTSGPVSIVMVGEGPERSAIEQAAQSAANVSLRCTGAITDLAESAPWIAAADALVNPGYLGLSVNHAFSLGVPVVAPAPAPSGAGHSPEWAYVRGGHNGILTNDAEVNTMTDAVSQILEHSASWQQRAASFAREHLSLDRMVAGLMEALSLVPSAR